MPPGCTGFEPEVVDAVELNDQEPGQIQGSTVMVLSGHAGAGKCVDDGRAFFCAPSACAAAPADLLTRWPWDGPAV